MNVIVEYMFTEGQLCFIFIEAPCAQPHFYIVLTLLFSVYVCVKQQTINNKYLLIV